MRMVRQCAGFQGDIQSFSGIESPDTVHFHMGRFHEREAEDPPITSMKQYVPKKPFRCGLKVWDVAVCKNGYFVDIDVYVGWPSEGEGVERDLASRVVLKLTEPFRNKNHHVFCDNFLMNCYSMDCTLVGR